MSWSLKIKTNTCAFLLSKVIVTRINPVCADVDFLFEDEDKLIITAQGMS